MRTCSILTISCYLCLLTAVPAYANNLCQLAAKDTLPLSLKGTFIDDYQITYRITDSTWKQTPGGLYHIIRHNATEKYIIARNDSSNKTDGGMYTRIDYMFFEGMEPYLWCYCLTVYNAATDNAAERSAGADRAHPRKGCGGFPFSRMKRIE